MCYIKPSHQLLSARKYTVSDLNSSKLLKEGTLLPLCQLCEASTVNTQNAMNGFLWNYSSHRLQ